MEQNILLATDKSHIAQSLSIKYSQESCSLFFVAVFHSLLDINVF